MKLIEKNIIKGIITLETGLHIGGSKSSLDIGGLDSPVIKTPLGVPYIPGSSLKGKIRSLLAKKEGSGSEEEDSVLLRQLFGCVAKNKEEITRLIFRDANMDTEKFKATFTKQDAILETDYSEGKWENTIDRKSSKANPRQLERIPAGAVFNFEIVMDIYENDNKLDMLNTLKEGFELLENDYLGGSGTRGYGKIKITSDIENPEIKTYAP